MQCMRLFQLNNGFLAEIKGQTEFMRYLLRLTQNVYQETQRVWVYAEVRGGHCSSFEKNYIVEEEDCFLTLHPFVCEKGTYIYTRGCGVVAPTLSLYHIVIRG
jgi:hypothetical protein